MLDNLISQLDHLGIACPKCDRLRRYRVRRLAMQHGRDATGSTLQCIAENRVPFDAVFRSPAFKRGDCSDSSRNSLTGQGNDKLSFLPYLIELADKQLNVDARDTTCAHVRGRPAVRL